MIIPYGAWLLLIGWEESLLVIVYIIYLLYMRVEKLLLQNFGSTKEIKFSWLENKMILKLSNRLIIMRLNQMLMIKWFYEKCPMINQILVWMLFKKFNRKVNKFFPLLVSRIFRNYKLIMNWLKKQSKIIWTQIDKIRMLSNRLFKLNK